MIKKLKIIEKILSEYLDPKSFKKYKNLMGEKGKTKQKGISSLSNTDSKQLEADLSASNFYIYIDFLITFAEDNLSSSKYLELLIFLGEAATVKGELSSAQKIFHHLISYTSHKTKFKNISAYAKMSLGDIYSRQASWEESKKYINSAKIIFKNLNDYKGIAKCENLLGTIYGEKGELKKAQRHFEESLKYLNPKKDKLMYGTLVMNLGILNNIFENFDKAFNYYNRSLLFFQEEKNIRRLSEVTGNIGILHLQKGEYKQALKSFDKSYIFAKKADVLNPICITFMNKSLIYTKLCDYPLAKVFAEKAMEIANKIDDKLTVADIYKIKGIIERNLKNYLLSKTYLKTSLRINTELENYINIAETQYEMGLLYKDLKKKKEAMNSFVAAKNIYKNNKMNILAKKMQSEINFL